MSDTVYIQFTGVMTNGHAGNISETTADIAGNQTPMPEDQRELYTMQTTSAKVSRRQRHRGG